MPPHFCPCSDEAFCRTDMRMGSWLKLWRGPVVAAVLSNDARDGYTCWGMTEWQAHHQSTCSALLQPPCDTNALSALALVC